MKRLALALCLAALAAPALDAQVAPAPAPAPAPVTATSVRRRVAVLDFDYGTVHSNVTGIMGSDVDIGKGIAIMLVSKLAQNGTYTVMERAQLDRVLNEQNFQQDSRADVSSAAKLGRLLGVDAIIIGSITQFQREDKNIQLGMRRESKATVAIDARIIQIGTGEILAVAQGKGQSKRAHFTSTEEDRARDLGGRDMWSSNLASTLLGEATRAAVDSLVIGLAAGAPKIPETVAAITALVADVSGSELIINVGTTGGVRVGSEYTVVRPGREIRDPATGSVLRRTSTPVGKIKITSADEGSATGTLTGDLARVGDCVGTCPLAPGAAQPPPQEQAAAPAPPTPPAPPASSSPASFSASGGALPALYASAPSGQFMWSAYSFKGTEHFRYDAFQTMAGQSQSGFYQIDASPGDSGRTRLHIEGQMGRNAMSATTSVAPEEGVPMSLWERMGTSGMALFSPSYGALLGGHQWKLGEGWGSSYGDQTMAFKVESPCQYAGVQGLRGVLRQNNKVIMDLCVSPHVGFPLAVTMGDGSGITSYGVKLAQFRP